MKLRMLTRVHGFDVEGPKAVSKSVPRVDCRDTGGSFRHSRDTTHHHQLAIVQLQRRAIRKKLCAVSQLKLAYTARVRSSPATTL
ncbi:hypothetical protein FIBSPDRAFT_865544, partial [Athelia psychrophila]